MASGPQLSGAEVVSISVRTCDWKPVLSQLLGSFAADLFSGLEEVSVRVSGPETVENHLRAWLQVSGDLSWSGRKEVSPSSGRFRAARSEGARDPRFPVAGFEDPVFMAGHVARQLLQCGFDLVAPGNVDAAHLEHCIRTQGFTWEEFVFLPKCALCFPFIKKVDHSLGLAVLQVERTGAIGALEGHTLMKETTVKYLPWMCKESLQQLVQSGAIFPDDVQEGVVSFITGLSYELIADVVVNERRYHVFLSASSPPPLPPMDDQSSPSFETQGLVILKFDDLGILANFHGPHRLEAQLNQHFSVRHETLTELCAAHATLAALFRQRLVSMVISNGYELISCTPGADGVSEWVFLPPPSPGPLEAPCPCSAGLAVVHVNEAGMVVSLECPDDLRCHVEHQFPWICTNSLRRLALLAPMGCISPNVRHRVFSFLLSLGYELSSAPVSSWGGQYAFSRPKQVQIEKPPAE
ncbi:unnamed protein product [Polarella glacialis]|uniref:Uncharacterized protein n=1 Tax=Polarella glacialis TaxID=89957 RepID=A0A813I1C9_POLGL|nr:unnamed protein product [Polarella glacialis]